MGQQNMAPNMRNTYEENNIKNASEAESKSSAVEFIREYQSPLISMVLLILAFVFVIFYKRKRF